MNKTAAVRAGRAARLAGFLALLVTAPLAAQQPRCAPDDLGLTLPDGFCAVLVADSLGRARHFAVASNGDVFIATPARDQRGGVWALRDADGDGTAETRHQVVRDPLAAGVRLRTDGQGSWIYYGTYQEIIRLPWTPGSLEASGPPDTVVRGLAGARQHGIKTFTLGAGNRLFVNHGAPSNSCQQDDRQPRSPGVDPCPLLDTTGGIWLFDADRTGQTRTHGRRYATGMRNTVALAVRPVDGALYGAVHGRDVLGATWGYSDSANAEKPSEEFVRIVDGADFGWPYCYHDPALGKRVLAPEYGGDGQAVGRCAQKRDPLIAFPAHWAPNGLLFYSGTSFPARYRGGAFIAFHGSWNRAPLPQQGFKIVFVPFVGEGPGQWEVFADGFQAQGARPVDVALGPDGSLYVSDDGRGRVYRILYRGR